MLTTGEFSRVVRMWVTVKAGRTGRNRPGRLAARGIRHLRGELLDVVSRVGDAATEAPLWVLLKEDFERHGRAWSRPGLHGLVVHRIGRWARSDSGSPPLRLVARIVHRLLNVLVIRNVYGMEISADAIIGRRVLIG